MQNFKKSFRREIRELKLLFASIPAPMFTAFAVSVIVMNLLANKSIDLPVSWLALDCGFIVSWISFLSMDVITKHFGPKAATQVSVAAVLTNLAVCLLFFAASKIPGVWGESYVAGSESIINAALDNTFGGTWYVLLGSTTAFLLSAVVNNFLNFAIGRLFRKNPDGFAAYAMRTYISTAIGQLADNLTFAFIVSKVFFGWSLTQCITCSIVGMLAELLCEVIFSPVGYSVCRRWKRDGVGKAYLDYIAKRGSAATEG